MRIHALIVLTFATAINALAGSGAIAQPRGQGSQGGYIRADGQVVDARVLPAPGTGCAPLAIISHGLGGDKRGNPQLAAALSRAGFRVVVPSHAESGPSLLRATLAGGAFRDALIRAAGDKRLLALRLEDIGAILDAEERRCTPPFRLLAGHSMGSRTVLIEAGARNRADLAGRDRFDAYIAISPAGEGTSLFPSGAMRPIRKPMLLVTGTRDFGEGAGYETRLTSFDGLPPGRKRLAVISGAGHFQLGGAGPGSNGVGQAVGVLAVEFAGHIRPGPWRAAAPRRGVEIAEK
jgi:predicted dienelactone hydrolase